jgi:hypothetical protein
MGGEGADLTPGQSAEGIRTTLGSLQHCDRAIFVNYDGTPLSW